jgi:hypothetical protein
MHLAMTSAACLFFEQDMHQKGRFGVLFFLRFRYTASRNGGGDVLDFDPVKWNSEAYRRSFRFYGELGEALSQWANVESGVCALYLRAIGARDEAAQVQGAKQFYGRRKFHLQVKLTDAALVASAPVAIVDQWRSLAKRAQVLSFERNKLAHGVVVMHGKNDDEGVYVLYPPPVTLQHPCLFVEHFEPLRASFTQLGREMRALKELWT